MNHRTLRIAQRTILAMAAFLLAPALPADVFSSSSNPASCDEAKAREADIHKRNLAEILKKRLDENKRYRHDRARCQGSDDDCYRPASRKHAQEVRKLTLETQDEGTRYEKALVDVRTNYCSSRRVTAGRRSTGGTSQGSGEAPPAPAPPPPAPPTRRPPSNPLVDTGEYYRGLADGIGDCVKGFGDALAGVGFMMRGDFVNAARVLGLTPGESVVLKTIFQESQQQLIGQDVSPYQVGRISGRRLCAYGVAPGAMKAGGTAIKARIPGATPLRPLRGKAVLQASTNAPETLAGQWVSTPNGPVQLGGFRGAGTFGSVYQSASNPRHVIKVSNTFPDSANSFPRQLDGSVQLTGAGVATPAIHQVHPGGATQPAFLIMDDFAAKYPEAYQFTRKAYGELTAGERAHVLGAVEAAGNRIGNAGLVWADNHLGNLAFVRQGGGLMAIVVDADMVMAAAEISGSMGSVPGMLLSGVLDQAGLGHVLQGTVTGPGVMQALFRARYGLAPRVGGSTAPGQRFGVN